MSHGQISKSDILPNPYFYMLVFSLKLQVQEDQVHLTLKTRVNQCEGQMKINQFAICFKCFCDLCVIDVFLRKSLLKYFTLLC